MTGDPDAPSIWVRAIADERFREALVEDPLRALAGTGAVTLLVLTIILQFVTGPVSAHLVGRAAHRHGDWDRAGAAVAELAEVDEL